MSAFWSGYAFTGVFLTSNEAEVLVSNISNEMGDTDEEDVELMFLTHEGITLNEKHLDFFELADESEGIRFTSLNGDSWFVDTGILCLESEHQPSLFNQAYEDKEALMKELKGKLDGLVPDDFPWENRVGTIQYAVYC